MTQAKNPVRQEKKKFCREYNITGKKYQRLMKKNRKINRVYNTAFDTIL